MSILNLNIMYCVKFIIILKNVNISELNKNLRFEYINVKFKCYSVLFSFNEFL